MFSKYYKGMMWESLPKGDEKDKLMAATDDELEKLYDKSKVKAMEIYRDYKNFKKTIKDGVVKFNDYNNNYRDISLLSDSIEKTLIGLLTKSYSLSKSEINSTKGIISNAIEGSVRMLRAAGGMLSTIFGGDPIAETKFETDVKKPIKELCELFKKKNNSSCDEKENKKFEEKINKDIEEIFNKFKYTQASLEGYVDHVFKQFPKNESFENMPGVQVFLRILLGLAGVERAGKSVSSDGVGNGKARANYVFNYGGERKYSFGGGLLALLVYNTMVYYVKAKSIGRRALIFLSPENQKKMDRESSEVRGKLDQFKDKYGK